jgi:hypothetical protein
MWFVVGGFPFVILGGGVMRSGERPVRLSDDHHVPWLFLSTGWTGVGELRIVDLRPRSWNDVLHTCTESLRAQDKTGVACVTRSRLSSNGLAVEPPNGAETVCGYQRARPDGNCSVAPGGRSLTGACTQLSPYSNPPQDLG